jgi:hypothetical protein
MAQLSAHSRWLTRSRAPPLARSPVSLPASLPAPQRVALNTPEKVPAPWQGRVHEYYRNEIEIMLTLDYLHLDYRNTLRA